MTDRKTVLVTGAGKGIGRVIALELAKEGYNIAINYRSNQEEAEKVRMECESLGAKSHIFKADVSDYSKCETMVKSILEEFSSIDVLVNNAGITRDNLVMRMTTQDFVDVLNANLVGAFNCTKLVSKLMMKKRTGCIINISSIVGLRGNVGQANYSASKAGLIGMTKTLAKELAPRNITVNAIAPGFIETDMTDKLSDEIKIMMKEGIPLKKFGQPLDIANTVVFLAGDKASYITGQTISVDGGMNI